jgi:phytoene synthase
MRSEKPDIQLAISYARRGREGIAALLDLDDRLAQIVRRASDPLVGQMRLTWWREALEALDRAPPPAEPILRALAEHVLPCGVTGTALAAVTEGWEALLEEPFGDEAMARHAVRGAALFEAMAVVTGAADTSAAEAGRGWALADLALHLGDAGLGARVEALARPHLAAARTHRWSRAGRAIGALALLARQDLDRAGPVTRILRLLRHRLTGR